MKPNNIHPRRPRRAHPVSRQGIWAAALLVLLSLGSGAALADDRRGGRDGYHHRHNNSCDHRADRNRHHRYDRHRHDHRYDRHRYDHRYDRHRRDHRYDRHRYDHRYDRHRRDHRYDRHYRGSYNDPYRYRSNPYRYRSFSIPRMIVHDLLHHYRPYHHGRLYHKAHGHYHQVYRFPVYADHGVEYYPYAYCEGSFFGRGTFRNGRAVFDVHINF